LLRAVGASSRLARASQPRRHGIGVGGVASQRATWTALRADGVAEADCQAPWPGIGVSLTRATKRCVPHSGSRRYVMTLGRLPILPIQYTIPDLSRFSS